MFRNTSEEQEEEEEGPEHKGKPGRSIEAKDDLPRRCLGPSEHGEAVSTSEHRRRAGKDEREERTEILGVAPCTPLWER
jgi:hypothetical protein